MRVRCPVLLAATAMLAPMPVTRQTQFIGRVHYKDRTTCIADYFHTLVLQDIHHRLKWALPQNYQTIPPGHPWTAGVSDGSVAALPSDPDECTYRIPARYGEPLLPGGGWDGQSIRVSAQVLPAPAGSPAHVFKGELSAQENIVLNNSSAAVTRPFMVQVRSDNRPLPSMRGTGL